MKCKNISCGKEFNPPKKTMNHQVYCCRKCAPYGYMLGQQNRGKNGQEKKVSIYDKKPTYKEKDE